MLSVEPGAPPNATTAVVRALATAVSGLDGQLHQTSEGGLQTLQLRAGFAAVVYTDTPYCLPRDARSTPVPDSPLLWGSIPPTASDRKVAICGHEAGWIIGEVPQFMQRSR